MDNKIIKGSESWRETIPEEHAMKCIQSYENNSKYRILRISFVRGMSGVGFVQDYGVVIMPIEIKEIIISRTGSMPSLYFVEDGKISYQNEISKFDICLPQDCMVEVEKTFHYSGKEYGKEESQESSPYWIREFAKENKADVLYMKFK